MKMNKILLTIVSVAILGCTNDFEDMNKDPLAINEVSPTLILPYMQHNGFRINLGDYQMSSLLYSALYCQYHANTATGFNSGNYVFNNKWAERGLWNTYYQAQLKNLREVEQMLPEHPEYDDMYQIMRIVTAMGSIIITDTFGDVPYFEAGKGDTQTPYDSQKAIYYDIFKELTEASDLLKQKRANQSTYGEEDLMYQGNVNKWIKLANSLRLRAACRISFIDPDKAKAEGEAALKETLLESNADNAGIVTADYGTEDQGNPVVGKAAGRNEYRASKTIIDMLQNISTVTDPRLPLMFSQTEAYVRGISDIQYRGVPNGLPVSELAKEEFSNMYNSNTWGYMWGYTWNNAAKGSNVSTPTNLVLQPLMMMNYAEVCFLKAEAALRGWSGAGNAGENYRAGIIASLEEMRANAPDGSWTADNDETYMTTGDVAWDDNADFETKLRKIITQKWIGIYPNSNEAWAECRRTGYPILNPIQLSLESTINPENGEFIKKLRYVDNEQINNANNALDPSLNGGKGDGVNVRVWWDTGRYK